MADFRTANRYSLRFTARRAFRRAEARVLDLIDAFLEDRPLFRV